MVLNIEIDFDNTLRFTGTQEEVQCYDVVNLWKVLRLRSREVHSQHFVKS